MEDFGMNGQQSVVGNAVKLVGEVVLPGASKIIDGNIISGLPTPPSPQSHSQPSAQSADSFPSAHD